MKTVRPCVLNRGKPKSIISKMYNSSSKKSSKSSMLCKFEVTLTLMTLHNSYLCDELSKLIFTGAVALVGRAT
jgi:hypothetical protein